MSFEACKTCGVNHFTERPHTCPPTWRVWCPGNDEGEGEARTIYEYDAESAAAAWAEDDDQDSAEYSIARGTPAVVHVRDPRTGELTRWSVVGEYDPTYHAAQMDPEPETEGGGG